MWRIFTLFLAFAITATAADLSRVEVATSKTSIYVGKVTLELTPLVKQGSLFTGEYRAKVFPYFFMGERGSFHIELNADQLKQILTGDRVEIRGEGKNSDGEPRRVEGYAQADRAGSRSGKIKVKIFVSKKIELIFNTTYRFP